MCQAASFKDQGNEEFKRGNWLKAAAIYTKGLKEDPESAVLYSNRSAALLQLKKAAKALEDAEECIKRRPDWDKGWFRKSLALELTGKYSEALKALETALTHNPDNAELVRKRHSLRKLVRDSESQSNRGKENEGSNKAPPKSGKVAPVAAEESKESDEAASLCHAEPDVLEFRRQTVEAALEQEDLQPAVYFLGPPSEDIESSISQVQIKEAFQSPEVLQNCLSFLRDYAKEKSACAACAVVPLSAIAYPQVWKRRGWPIKGEQGSLIQLEMLKLRQVWYLPKDAKHVSDAVSLSEDFKVLEPLFR